MSTWPRNQNSRHPLEASDYAAARDRIVSSSRWYGCIFGASAVLQVAATCAVEGEPDALVRFAVPAITFGFSAIWLSVWYASTRRYDGLRATLINADVGSARDDPSPFWVDSFRVLLVAFGYLQVLVVLALLLWRGRGEAGAAVLLQLGPGVAWPSALVLVAVALRDVLRPGPTGSSADKVHDRVRTLEVRADNARLPEPEAGVGQESDLASSEEFRVLVEKSPRAAVVLAWREIEQALQRFAIDAGIPYDARHPFRLMQDLMAKVPASAAVKETIDGLRKIRNEALHADREITPPAAEEYLWLTRRVIQWFRQSARPVEAVADGQNAEADGRPLAVTLLGLADPNKKISVIKAVRELTGHGLADGKNLVDSAPAMLTRDLTLEEATRWKDHLESAGAIVRLTAPA